MCIVRCVIITRAPDAASSRQVVSKTLVVVVPTRNRRVRVQLQVYKRTGGTRRYGTITVLLFETWVYASLTTHFQDTIARGRIRGDSSSLETACSAYDDGHYIVVRQKIECTYFKHDVCDAREKKMQKNGKNTIIVQYEWRD